MSTIRQRGYAIVIGIVSVVLVGAIAALVAMFMWQPARVQEKGNENTVSRTTETENQTRQVQRDKIRHQHHLLASPTCLLPFRTA